MGDDRADDARKAGAKGGGTRGGGARAQACRASGGRPRAGRRHVRASYIDGYPAGARPTYHGALWAMCAAFDDHGGHGDATPS